MRVKIISYNIHRGLSAFRRIDVCDAIFDLLISSEADVVCLQEVWQKDGVSEHQLEQLCDRNWSYQVYETNAIFPNGAQGNAILSRYPVSHSRNIDITVARLEPRGLLHAVVHLPTPPGSLAILCVHLGLFHYERVRQLATIEYYINETIATDLPLILAGDFNDWNGRGVRAFAKRLFLKEAVKQKHGRFGVTYPAVYPILPLDRIYYRNCEVRAAQIVKYMNIKSLSDHLPVEAIFTVSG